MEPLRVNVKYTREKESDNHVNIVPINGLVKLPPIIEDDNYTFECSGRKINDAGYLGISNNLEIATGYDQKISIVDDFGSELTPEEKNELAKTAITRWAIYGNIELIW